ncbi:MAG TPA: flagellar export chaperone FlgN [Synergistaceae bacterium]|mgnify:CR=1 FL=1|nr:flagellar export chaperone FlgN [Synergistaceae bacterium]
MALQLVSLLEEQGEVLLQMWQLAGQQREALKEGQFSTLQEMMKDFQALSSRALALEASRQRESLALGKKLSCPPVLTEFVRHVPEDEDAEALRQAGITLLKAIKKLRAEMHLLEKLLQEQSALNELLINEWRRLEGLPGMDPSGGSFDFRG